MENRGIPEQEIEKRAYQRYLECGCDGGHDIEHWLAAEEELRQERASQNETVPLLKSQAAAAGAGGTGRTRRSSVGG
jgi:hypothetical protein